MRPLVAAALSLVSLLGGHCLNRRWDRVVVFGVLAVGATAAVWLGFSRELSEAAASGSFEGHVTAYARGQLAVMAVLLVASAAVSLRDARRPAGAAGHVAAMTAGGIASVAIALVTLTSVAGLVAMALPQAHIKTTASSSGPSEIEGRYNFSHYVRLGNKIDAEGEPESVPAGDATLQGRVVFRGEPQQGVTLRLILNGRYETELLTTDADGRFTVSVPSGEWRINQVRTQGWTGRPDDGSFTVITGHEPTFDLPYARWQVHDQAPRTVELPDDGAAPHLRLRIRRAIALEWPAPNEEPIQARLEADAIAWDDPADAERYVVTVRRIEQEGDTTHYRTRTSVRVDGAQRLPLRELPTAEAKGGPRRYEVDVHGFDASGRLVNYNATRMAEPRFTLRGAKIVDNSEWIDEGGDEAADTGTKQSVDWAARSRAEDRLEAVRTLIEAGMLDAAGGLLERVDTDHAPPGEAPVMRGYLAAKRGRCEAARQHFDAAHAADPDICIASCYYADCPQPAQGE